MTDIKRKVDQIENKAIEKKGEIKGRIKQMQKDSDERSVNEE